MVDKKNALLFKHEAISQLLGCVNSHMLILFGKHTLPYTKGTTFCCWTWMPWDPMRDALAKPRATHGVGHHVEANSPRSAEMLTVRLRLVSQVPERSEEGPS